MSLRVLRNSKTTTFMHPSAFVGQWTLNKVPTKDGEGVDNGDLPSPIFIYWILALKLRRSCGGWTSRKLIWIEQCRCVMRVKSIMDITDWQNDFDRGYQHLHSSACLLFILFAASRRGRCITRDRACVRRGTIPASPWERTSGNFKNFGCICSPMIDAEITRMRWTLRSFASIKFWLWTGVRQWICPQSDHWSTSTHIPTFQVSGTTPSKRTLKWNWGTCWMAPLSQLVFFIIDPKAIWQESVRLLSMYSDITHGLNRPFTSLTRRLSSITGLSLELRGKFSLVDSGPDRFLGCRRATNQHFLLILNSSYSTKIKSSRSFKYPRKWLGRSECQSPFFSLAWENGTVSNALCGGWVSTSLDRCYRRTKSAWKSCLWVWMLLAKFP